MLPLTGQIQRASDTAKGCVVRLGAVEPASFPDTEASFEELQARIGKTVELLRRASVSRLDDAERRKVELKFRDHAVTFEGRDYVTLFVLPNFYFHVTTAYDLLRHKGLEIGKADYSAASTGLPPAPEPDGAKGREAWAVKPEARIRRASI